MVNVKSVLIFGGVFQFNELHQNDILQCFDKPEKKD